MKNFKIIIILSCIFFIIIIYIIYRIISNGQYQEIYLNESIVNNIGEEEALDNTNYIVLHITGEVVNPGIVKIEENSRVVDAIEAAGGITQNADLNKINLAYMLKDGQKLYIPSINDEEEQEYITEDIGENIKENAIVQNGKVNINTATQNELETLMGIGASTALKIINYRKENGKFNNIEEIKNVPGIGESKFQIIKNEICV